MSTKVVCIFESCNSILYCVNLLTKIFIRLARGIMIQYSYHINNFFRVKLSQVQNEHSYRKQDGQYYLSKKYSKKTFAEHVNFCSPESYSIDEVLTSILFCLS